MVSRKFHAVNSQPSFSDFEEIFRLQVVDLVQLSSSLEELIRDFNTYIPTAFAPEIGMEIRRLRAQNFYGCARFAAAVRSAYAMEEKFNDESVGTSPSGNRRNSGKWRGYRAGRHLPRPNTVKKAESIAKVRLQGQLDHVLWAAMDTRSPLEKYAVRLVRRLPRKSAIPTWKALSRLNAQYEVEWHRTMDLDWPIWQLMNECSLSSLAALTILYRLSAAKSLDSTTFLLREYILTLLMMLAPELHARGIARGLFSFYLRHVFQSETDQLLMVPIDLAKASAFLNLTAFSDPDLKGITQLTHAQWCTSMLYIAVLSYETCASAALLTISRRTKPESLSDENCQIQNKIEFVGSNWDAVVEAMETGRSPTVGTKGNKGADQLNFRAYEVLRADQRTISSTSDHSSLPTPVWWSTSLPRVKIWPTFLQSLLKRDWPRV